MKWQIEMAGRGMVELTPADVLVRPFRSTSPAQPGRDLWLQSKLRAGHYTECMGSDKGAVLQCCHDNGKKDVFKAVGPEFIEGYTYYCDGMGPDYGSGDWD